MLLLGITGASGMPYAARLIEVLQELKIEFAGVISSAALEIFRQEARDKLHLLEGFYREKDFHAPFSSGSSAPEAMVIVPCSMKTLSAIAHGYASNLITRSADVVLKEGKKLILVPRETPLNVIHLENMLTLAKLGAVVLPAMPAFYHEPKTIEDMVNFVVGKVLDNLGIENSLYRRWGSEP